MSIDMSQFYQVFFDEAEELLAEKEKLLLAVDIAAPDGEDLNAIFRAAHSIKGGAATFGFTDITEVTHILESLLDRIRKGEMALTTEHVDAFLAAKDILKMLMDGHRHGAHVDQEEVQLICQRLLALSQDGAGSASIPAAPAVPVKPIEHGVTETVSIVAGMRCYRIELPEVPQRDVDALAAELGLMGTLTQAALNDKCCFFTISTAEKIDDIVAVCSFVLDPADLKISDQTAADSAPTSMHAIATNQRRILASIFDPFPG